LRIVARGRSAGIVRGLGTIALALFFLGAFTPLAAGLYARLAVPARLEPADAIVVLAAGGVLPDGQLTDSSRRRTAFGIDLYHQGLAPRLVLSGALARRSESAARAALARECGVPETAILARATGHTTHEEIAGLGELLRARGVRRVLLVTDGPHMRRAMGLLLAARFDVLPAPVHGLDVPTSPADRFRLLRETVQEALALAYYRAAGYL
jgi:uncharacterized SAM-binding protein YcdF (DUF218 family)